MNTREIAVEYRLSHWARIMQERTDSGLSIRDFCKREGIHENVYYYWQRKLRESVCQELTPIQHETKNNGVIPTGWAVCEPSIEPTISSNAISIEIGKSRVNVSADANAELLDKVCRVLMSLC